MQDEINAHIKIGTELMDQALERLERELSKIRTGKASPAMIKDLKVDYYGSPTPLGQVANISAPDPKTLSIQPWEKSMLGAIEQAIFGANIGLTPMNDGEFVRINIPPLTEDRRKEMVKIAKALGEDAKVSLRGGRHKILDYVKKAVKDGYPEDMGKKVEDDVQKLTNSYADRVNKAIDNKEIDIMKV